ncbi:hypothetical protein MPL3365_110056 [Mesorhizobium plurifarium]|uniref:Uncharacterized protein n=1 Tax=Mesorhizobium plurifarium TaxID=69974 RepID=A0A090G132_MESPL|nr:hypothetical protein MPL3365_110056 [Mesorhizobium plurifarium]
MHSVSRGGCWPDAPFQIKTGGASALALIAGRETSAKFCFEVSQMKKAALRPPLIFAMLYFCRLRRRAKRRPRDRP